MSLAGMGHKRSVLSAVDYRRLVSSGEEVGGATGFAAKLGGVRRHEVVSFRSHDLLAEDAHD